ncbi:hypothetical protein SCATT_p04690 (plasmid) [Streptantibioticus cattleyicolor NRRL 8057 = DSM 46488]|uniref:Uncharacterized protein n=1 Tax=Streptantibioticus cattleyicolor (strain ATCC 35852 / DSM 46488 / JCM 4925 / NBRC 14057 / NRRL 8057) TaxID=1003195 RepID=G8XGA4_STREN|nr:hypothetical protein SCATT_p04690 [Streptantibioticus cattleyicolor NRRL 8057 = DSM 46488]
MCPAGGGVFRRPHPCLRRRGRPPLTRNPTARQNHWGSWLRVVSPDPRVVRKSAVSGRSLRAPPFRGSCHPRSACQI